MTSTILLSLSISASVCGSAQQHIDHFRSQMQFGLSQSYVMTGMGGSERYTAYIGQDYVRAIRRNGRFTEKWDDEDDASTHTLWNGFTGVAAPWRADLRHAIDDVLTGRLGLLPIERVPCRRKHSKTYLVLTLRSRRDVRLDVSLDSNSDLPDWAEAYKCADHQTISQVRYTRIGSDLVPTRWADGDNVFSFARVTDDSFSNIVQTTPLAPIASRHSIRLISNEHNKYSRGVNALINGKPSRLLIDTGGAITVLSASFAAHAGVRPIAPIYARVASGYQRANLGIARSIRFGTFRLQNEPVVILPSAFGYDGAIGSSLFGRADVEFSEGFITLVPPLREGHVQKLLDTYDGIPVISGVVSRQNAHFLLDTGAAFDALFPGRFRPFGRPERPSPVDCRISGLPIMFAPRTMRFDGVRIGPSAFRVDACVTQFDDLTAPNLEYPVLGFRALFRRLRSLRYQRGTVDVRDDRRGAAGTDGGALPTRTTRLEQIYRGGTMIRQIVNSLESRCHKPGIAAARSHP